MPDPCITEEKLRWLKEHRSVPIRLDRSCLQPLLDAFDFRIAGSRTIFGDQIEEYREYRKWDSLHLRDMGTHLELHSDKLNPDWDFFSFIGHFFTDILHVA